MFLLLTDETNIIPSKQVVFFVYGGLVIDTDRLPNIHAQVSKVRKKYGFRDGDELKFDTNSKPSRISKENFNAAKNEVIDICTNNQVQFIVYLVHHYIAKNKTKGESIRFGLNTILNQYDSFLTNNNSYGLCSIDNIDSGFRVTSEIFQHGLKKNTNFLKMERILHYSQTSINSGHANSLVDIVLGAFRYCVNERDKTIVPSKMLPKITELIWSEVVRGKKVIHGKGLAVRPLNREKYPVKVQEDYSELLKHLDSILSSAKE